MSTSFESVVSSLDQLNIRHFPDAGTDIILIPYRTAWGQILIVARVECEGEYLAFHSEMPSYFQEESGIGQLIAEQNAVVRIVQIGRQGNRITAHAGVWLMDSKLTSKVLERYLDNFVGVTARAFAEIRSALEGKSSFHTVFAEAGTA